MVTSVVSPNVIEATPCILISSDELFRPHALHAPSHLLRKTPPPYPPRHSRGGRNLCTSRRAPPPRPPAAPTLFKHRTLTGRRLDMAPRQ